MKKLSLTILALVTLGCMASSFEFAVFNTKAHVLKIPVKYVESGQDVSAWIEHVKDELDDDDGMILLSFLQDEIIENVKGFKKSKANSASLVLMYDEDFKQELVLAGLQKQLSSGKRKLNKNSELGGYNIYQFEDVWDVVDGTYADSKNDFIVNKLIASCESGFFGASCKFYAEMNGAYFTYSLKNENITLYKSVEGFYRQKINNWVYSEE